MTGQILIIDRSVASRALCAARLDGAFYTPLSAEDDDGGLSLARRQAPDLVLVTMAAGEPAPGAVIAALRTDPSTRMLPIIALVPGNAPALRVAAFTAGADEALPHPADEDLLLARIHSLLRLRGEVGLIASALGQGGGTLPGLAEPAPAFDSAPRIALIAERPETARGWKAFVRSRIGNRMTVLSHAEALGLLASTADDVPDVMMIEADSGESDGLRLMRRLAERAPLRRSAFCIVSGDGDDATAVAAYEAGADDVVSPGQMEGELELRLRALLRRKHQKDRLRRLVERELRLASIDPLTGVRNRRYAQPQLAAIARQAVEDGTRFAVMVIDLDRFKSVNDRYGHAAGDAVLVEVASRLTGNLRISDLLARTGGEEFLVALPDTTLDEAHEVAERLRGAISDTPMQLPSGERIRVTASIGVAIGGGSAAPGGRPGADGSTATGDPAPPDGLALMQRADRALLSAKLGGRNLVTFSACAA